MASGDTVYETDAMYIATDEVHQNVGVTRFQHSNGDAIVIENAISGVHETVFDTEKTYDVIIKEH